MAKELTGVQRRISNEDFAEVRCGYANEHGEQMQFFWSLFWLKPQTIPAVNCGQGVLHDMDYRLACLQATTRELVRELVPAMEDGT